MGCQHCYRSEPAEYVELHHNVGMLFMRQTYCTYGRLCRECLHQAYNHHMLRNLTLGWWGTISFFATIYYLIANTVTYVSALRRLGRSKAPSAAAAPAVLDGDEAQRRLEPFEHNVRLRLRAGDAVEDIGRDLAALQGVHASAAARFVERVRSLPVSPANPG